MARKKNVKNYEVPNPVLNKRELDSMVVLTEKYEKLIQPGVLTKAGKKIVEKIPETVREKSGKLVNGLTEKELYIQCMETVAKGFAQLEKQASKMTISETAILNKINEVMDSNEITSIDEICLTRGYKIARLVDKYKSKDMALALVEGGVTGALGFVGLPFNLVLSTFLYYRAVQSVAMFYGYDVKNNPDELVIASNVFMSALSPASKGQNEITNIVGKVMVMTELTAVKQTAKKTWTDMATRGGATLLLTQMRALAHSSAKKALEKAGKKGLEESMFKGVFEQMGKGLTQKAIGKAVPVVGAAIGGLFDVAQMNTIIDYANIFYNKRYLVEKEQRVNLLLGIEEENIIDVTSVEVKSKKKTKAITTSKRTDNKKLARYNTEPKKIGKNLNYRDIKAVKEYMESKGILFTGGNVEIGNAKGYAIMGGKSSLRILENAKDGINGISIMCYKDKEDCDRLCNILKKEWYPNAKSDSTRLYKVPIAESELDDAIDALLKNQKNCR